MLLDQIFAQQELEILIASVHINETVRLGKKYDGNVQQIVSQLLSSSLGTSKKISSENTSNKYTFIGNQKRPFDTIQWLAPKSIKEQKSGGFLFFETIDGYVFKSVRTYHP